MAANAATAACGSEFSA
uniref:Uncharacterized protein n=1 Tax=Arundo donax TaxID=35708 RepID=A0A0A9B1W6_ARUDO